MKEKENIQKSEQKSKKSFKDINEFHDYLDERNKAELKAAQKQLKRPVSLEDMIAQTRRIQGS